MDSKDSTYTSTSFQTINIFTQEWGILFLSPYKIISQSKLFSETEGCVVNDTHYLEISFSEARCAEVIDPKFYISSFPLELRSQFSFPFNGVSYHVKNKADTSVKVQYIRENLVKIQPQEVSAQKEKLNICSTLDN